jgi:hypothetical protein
MARVAASALLAFIGICQASDLGDTKSWKHPEPVTYETLRAWHAEGGLKDYQMPREWHLDLNGDGNEEVFLAIEGYNRGMGYALFTRIPKGWHMIAERVEGSSHPFQILSGHHGAWHDFESVLPSGRGGTFEFVYTWDGKKYVKKSYREVTSKELSHE